jgi:hypothetical protein
MGDGITQAAIILDQRLSRGSPDRVDDWSERANAAWAGRLTRPFVRTAGDEMQALTDDPQALVGIVMDAVEDRGWWIGVGVGNVERPLGKTARESRGSAFWLAREALRKTKGQRATRSFVLRSERSETVDDLGACLHALAFIVLRRTRSQREVAILFRGGSNVAQIAGRRGVTPQAARQLLLAAGAEEEIELRGLAAGLAARALA